MRDELTAKFHNGLNVITGETGAGKSILISAIDLLFALRISKDIIKTGKEKAVIEGVFDNHELNDFLSQNNIDVIGNEIVVSREITSSSVRSRINGTLVGSDILRELRSKLVDIHSQHQTYSFMQPKYHINLLDSYGKNVYGADLNEYKNLYLKYQELKNQLEKINMEEEIVKTSVGSLSPNSNSADSETLKNTSASGWDPINGFTSIL